MKTVLITGASRGIGAACAELFAARGWRVLLNYRAEKAIAESLCAKLRKSGAEVDSFCADVADGAQVSAMFAQIRKRYDSLDCLVNNAGIAQIKLFQEITEEDWDRMFAVNIKGMYLCSKEAVPDMIRKQSGSIVNLSSMWGLCGASCEVHYSASKAAVIGFTKALAKELGPSRIRVNCVAPGAVETDMNASLSAEDLAALKEETPLCRIGSPRDIANAVYFLASEESGFTTGQVLSPNGGLVI